MIEESIEDPRHCHVRDVVDMGALFISKNSCNIA